MKKHRKVLMALALLCLVAVGLHIAGQWIWFQEMSFPQFFALVNGSEGRAATLWKGVDYCGEQNGRSYFCNRLGWMRKLVSIPVEHAQGFPRVPFTRLPWKWVDASRAEFFPDHLEFMPEPPQNPFEASQ